MLIRRTRVNDEIRFNFILLSGEIISLSPAPSITQVFYMSNCYQGLGRLFNGWKAWKDSNGNSIDFYRTTKIKEEEL